MIIDSHTHCFPDKIAGDAVRHLEKISGLNPSTAGTRNSLIESMNAAGIDISLNLPVATAPEQVPSINSWAEKNNSHPVYSFGSIHPDSPDPGKILSDVAAKGLRGIKMHPEYQNFSPDEKRLESIWEKCIDLDLFVYFHAGNDTAFKAPFYSSPAKFAKLHSRFPELKMGLAHFGSWRQWDDVEKEIIGRNIYLDTSFTAGFIDAEKLSLLIRRHGAEKIFFGTDCPWRNQKTELEAFMRLSLSKEEKALILYENAKTALGIP